MRNICYNIFKIRQGKVNKTRMENIMKEKFTEVYKKNVERMERAKAMYEIATKQGNKDLARKYRSEYIELKSEIDMYALQLIK